MDARQLGLEGRSRVIARRAIAKVLREFYKENSQASAIRSGYSLIEFAAQDQQIPGKIRAMLANLCQRVNVQFAFDDDVDILNISEQLVDWFSKE